MRLSIFRRIKRAFCGLFSIMFLDSSVRLMLLIGVFVISFSIWIGVSRIEKIVVTVIVFSVITIEGINTIIERVIDLVEPRYKEMIKEIKDSLAGFVLFSSMGAAIIGAMIFWPYFVSKFF